jgi:hypothetical protein
MSILTTLTRRAADEGTASAVINPVAAARAAATISIPSDIQKIQTDLTAARDRRNALETKMRATINARPTFVGQGVDIDAVNRIGAEIEELKPQIAKLRGDLIAARETKLLSAFGREVEPHRQAAAKRAAAALAELSAVLEVFDAIADGASAAGLPRPALPRSLAFLDRMRDTLADAGQRIGRQVSS